MAICFGKTPPKAQDATTVAERRETDSKSSDGSLGETVRDLPGHDDPERMVKKMTSGIEPHRTGPRRLSNKCNLV
jgi:hypothetical protein